MIRPWDGLTEVGEGPDRRSTCVHDMIRPQDDLTGVDWRPGGWVMGTIKVDQLLPCVLRHSD